MNKRFVIFCTARSGSYLLVDYLNQFKEVTCYGEIFKKEAIELPSYIRDNIPYNTVRKRDATPFKYMNQIHWKNNSKLVGFKIFPHHNQKILSHLIENKDVSKVILKRNEIEVHLSLNMARKTNLWINKGDRTVNNDLKIDFNPDTFTEHFNRINQFYSQLINKLEKFQHKHFLIRYSEVVQKEKIYNLMDFLSDKNFDSNIKLKTNLIKQIQKKYYDIVSNYDEMVGFLKDNYPKILEESKQNKENNRW